MRSQSYLERKPKFPSATREKPGDSPLNAICHLYLLQHHKEIPPSLLSLQSVLDTFDATQEFPGHIHLHSRGTSRVPPQLKKNPCFPSSYPEERPLPCFMGKGIPVFLLHLKRRRSQLYTRGELQGSCHHFIRPDVPMPFRYT